MYEVKKKTTYGTPSHIGGHLAKRKYIWLTETHAQRMTLLCRLAGDVRRHGYLTLASGFRVSDQRERENPRVAWVLRMSVGGSQISWVANFKTLME